LGDNRIHRPPSLARRSGRRAGASLAWPALLLTLVLVALAVVLDLLIRRDEGLAAQVGRYAYVAIAVPVTLVGAVITSRRPGNRIGLLMLAGGASVAGDQFAFDYVHYGLPAGLPGVPLLGWLGNWLWAVPPTTLLLALLLFPNGRLPSRRWRVAAWTVGAWAAATVLLAALGGGVYDGPPLYPAAAVPGPPNRLAASAVPALFSAFPVLLLVAAGSAVLRLCRARGEERQQLTWLVYAGSVAALAWLLPAGHQVGGWGRAVADLALWAVPAAIGVAVLRYRLYEIDRIVNRTLVYGALTACVGGVYVLSAALLGAVVEPRSGTGVSLASSALVAAFFAPLRARLQRAVNRLLYGQRDEPSAVMSRLGNRLEAAMAPGDVLPTIVETVAQALKLPYVAIELYQNGRFRPACARGVLAGEPVEFTLAYRGELLGRLVAGPRAPGEPFSPSDRQVLRDLARTGGIAVQAFRLTADLQRSRERLVAAREEERRRLRRDLHDGLGPTLAGVAYQVQAASRALPRDPARATELLTQLEVDVEQTTVEVRRLVDGLRPPVLDDLGLVPAIRQHGARFGGAGRRTLRSVIVDIRAPTSLPRLPAAVEVAAYRIATEAITNVVRHADARHCVVDIRFGDGLELEVTDDGRGIDSRPDGAGMTSMRERAEELGGTCVAEAGRARGTRIHVRLPVTLAG